MNPISHSVEKKVENKNICIYLMAILEEIFLLKINLKLLENKILKRRLCKKLKIIKTKKKISSGKNYPRFQNF